MTWKRPPERNDSAPASAYRQAFPARKRRRKPVNTARVRRLVLVSSVLVACATARPLPQRLDALEADGAECERFSTFDPQARALLDELLEGAPGDTLVSGSARVNAARRACARRTLDGLLTLREREGLEAVQTELDALVRAWPVDQVEAWLAEAPGGVDLVALGPLLGEARERAERERQSSARAALGASARLDTTAADCVGLASCAAAHCFAGLARGGADASGLMTPMRAAARQCLDEGRALAPDARAARTSALLLDTRAFQGLPEETEAALALETLRRAQWPLVQAAVAAGHFAGAWALAAPYQPLDAAHAEVAAVRQKAIAAHLEKARACGARALCARLHRRLAAEAGGPPEPALSAQPGRWERGRWACRRPPLALPDAPPAMTLRLDATCRKPKPASEPTEDEKPYELERELLGNALDGEVRATCAGRIVTAAFRVPGFADSTEGPAAEESEANARREVERVVPRLVADCRKLHADAAARACGELASSLPQDAEQTFAELAVTLGQWPKCFADWFERRYGVPPPRP